MFWHAPARHLPFQPSGRPNSPSPRVRERSRGKAHRGRCFGTPLRAISRFSHRTPRLPLLPVWEKGAGGRLTGVDVLARPCAPSPVSAIERPDSPFSPCGRRGQGEGSQGWMFWHAPARHLSFQPSERPDSPFSPCEREDHRPRSLRARTPRLPLLPV